MPKTSKKTASETIALEGLEVQLEHLEGGYSVCFESHLADADLADLFRGLPDDRSQLPRWGYVIEGKVAFRFADREGNLRGGRRVLRSSRALRLCISPARRSSSSVRRTRSPRQSRSSSRCAGPGSRRELRARLESAMRHWRKVSSLPGEETERALVPAAPSLISSE